MTPAIYQKFLERSLTRAESVAQNSYHCKTADCRGWCIYEDEANFFSCPICCKTNCLTCKAIHEGMNCRQYQDDLQIRAENDVAAKQTQEAIQVTIFHSLKVLKKICPKGRISIICRNCQNKFY